MIEKKVLFISNSIVGKNPGVSGGESRFIELGKYWKKMGYEIHLLSSEGGKTLCEKMGLEVVLHKIPSSDSETRAEMLRRTLALFWYVTVLLKDFKDGIVYSTSEQIYDVWPGFILKLFYSNKIKFASAVHWLPPLLFWTRKSSKWYNSLLFLISERTGLLLAYFISDALFPVSTSTYWDMHRFFIRGKKINTVKCGVNLKEIEQVVEQAGKEIKYEGIFLKRLQSVKGIFDLIDIWETVVKKFPKSQLIIIGSGIDEQEAKKIVKDKNLETNIKFLGPILDYAEKYKLICESKLFLLPSYEENWAIVIGEALACGTPVTVYRLKELEEVWKDSITYVNLSDKAAFADSIINNLTDVSVYQKRVEYGKSYVKRYDWEQIAADEIKFILRAQR
jgi:glycosyltransferase involved in cell wall biosynthesis